MRDEQEFEYLIRGVLEPAIWQQKYPLTTQR